MRRRRLLVLMTFVALALLPESPWAAERPTETKARCRDAMLRATRFMVEKVSTRGGYVWTYLPDLSRRWGEMEAYDSMIWIQPPGTTSMGHLFLDAYALTGDEYYYDAADKVARAIMWGQLDCGGWNYMVDFAGDRSLKEWHATIGKNAWRLEEFQHYYGNATFDDNVSSDAASFLLRIYLVKLDPVYRPALERAIQFVLDSQYPLGGWPQRYPLRYEFSHHGLPDYTSFYTFNDDVVWQNVRFLINCYMFLGQERFLAPIQRGLNFYLLAQQGAPNAGWAQQYTLDLKPAGARTYEPRALLPEFAAQHVELLLAFYRLTGESKFLARIPEALAWLESCRLPDAMTAGGRFTHPTFVDPETNAPVFVHRKGSNVVYGSYFVDNKDEGLLAHYGGKQRIDVPRLRSAYEETLKLPTDQVAKDSPLKPGRADGKANRAAALWDVPSLRPEWMAFLQRNPSASEIEGILSALDPQGRWLTKRANTSHPYAGDGVRQDPVRDYATTMVGDETDTSPYRDETDQLYISTGAYLRNMRALMRYLESAK